MAERSRVLFVIACMAGMVCVPSEAAEGAAEVRPLVEYPTHTVEPGYQDISLSDWLRKLVPGMTGGKLEDFLASELRPPTAGQQAAIRAVRTIGTNAIPNLLAKLEWLHSFQEGLAGFEALGREAVEAVPELRHILRTEQHPRSSMATLALGKIGPPAAAAIPELKQMFEAGGVSAAVSLGQIGCDDPELLEKFVEILKGPSTWHKTEIVIALGKLKSKAAPAVEELIRIATDNLGQRQPPIDQRRLQLRAIIALGEIQDHRAIPVLLEQLNENVDGGKYARRAFARAAANALGQFGPAAAAAKEPLLRMRDRERASNEDKAIANEALLLIGGGG